MLVAIDARASRGLAERAGELRELRPDALVLVGRSPEARLIADVVEAARAASAGDEAPPRVVSAADNDVHREAQAAASGSLEFWRTAHPAADGAAALVARLRVLRRRGGEPLAVETVESLIGSRLDARTTLACEVEASGARLGFGTRDGVVALEIPDVGIGSGADALAERVGAAALRRWLSTSLDVAGLRDRVANLACREDASGPQADALRLALARECLRLLARAARTHYPRDVLTAPHVVLVSGALAALDPAATVAALLEGLGPTGAFRVERTDGHPLALIVAEAARSALRLRIRDTRGSREIEVMPGEVARFPLTSDAQVEFPEGRRAVAAPAGPVGLVVDARPRPLSLPERDAERQALLAAWAGALGVPS